MAKKIKYPKKFRMKLEKIAEAKEERENGSPTQEEMDRVTRTLHQEFLGKGRVHFMRGKVDDLHRRLEMTYHLSPPLPFHCVGGPPPWLDEESPPSP